MPMSYKPILFNTEMVRAILDGRKTQTRRLLKPKYRPEEESFQIITNAHSGRFIRVEYCDEYGNETRWMPQPCEVGDILWVRETWGKLTECDVYPPYEPEEERFIYRADIGDPDHFQAKWHPSIHMPKEAARIFLRVKTVRVERLQEITQQQATAEGFPSRICEAIGYKYKTDDGKIHTQCGIELCVVDFVQLWNSTIKPADLPKYGWNANPWVWVIEFERCEKPKEW